MLITGILYYNNMTVRGVFVFNTVCMSMRCVIVVMGGLLVLSGQVTRRLVTRLVCTHSCIQHENLPVVNNTQLPRVIRLLSTAL